MMSIEEKARLYKLAQAAANRGEFAEAARIEKSIPLQPIVAKIAKEVSGADYIRNAGFNLADAEEAYGKDWLNR